MTRKPVKKLTKKLTKLRIKNPLQGTQNEAYDFQSLRFHLATVYKDEDPNEEWSFIGNKNEWTEMESLYRALKFLIPNGSLEKYNKELLTPRVMKAAKEFAKLLRQQAITTAHRSGIDSFTGLKIK